jgi:hypothetical protein
MIRDEQIFSHILHDSRVSVIEEKDIIKETNTKGEDISIEQDLIKKIFSDLSSNLDKNKRFTFYLTIFKRINWIVTLCIYGLFFQLYQSIMPSYVHNYLKDNPHIISCLQGLAIGINWSLTCGFHLVLHNFLFRVEIIADYLERDYEDFLLVSSIFSNMRRSIFPITRFFGRVGGNGLGNMGNPKGNGRQVLAWCAVTGAGLAMYNYRKYKVAELREKTKVHDIDTNAQSNRYQSDTNADASRYQHDKNAEASRYQSDTNAQSNRYQFDRKCDEYRKDKDMWDNSSIFTRGKPPTPPY